MALTNQQELDAYNKTLDSFLTSDKVMQKSVVTPDGVNITYRDFSDLLKMRSELQRSAAIEAGTLVDGIALDVRR